MIGRYWKLQHRFAPYLFVLPFILLFVIFYLYPLARSLQLSVHQTVGTRRETFVGLANYAYLLRDVYFWFAAVNTLLFAVAFVMLQIPLSLGLAMALNDRRVYARGIFRLAFFSTYLVGAAFVGIVFGQLLDDRHGLLNHAIGMAARRPVRIAWLSTPALAMPSVLLAALWLSVGYGMVYFLAALQAVDRSLYDAAAVDGAGRWTRFWHVTRPGVSRVTIFLSLLGFVGAMQLFELPYVLFNQSAGPANAASTVVMYLYFYGIQAGDFGYAAAVGWLLVLLMAAPAALGGWWMARTRAAA